MAPGTVAIRSLHVGPTPIYLATTLSAVATTLIQV
jgi:hypothetical protein